MEEMKLDDLQQEEMEKAIADIKAGYHTEFTVKMSLRALEKVVQQQVIREGLDDQDFVTCPVCKTILGDNDSWDFCGKQNYCGNCGQALKF